MNDEQVKELLMTNSKEWLVDQLISERNQYHKKMMDNIKFKNWLIDQLHTLTCHAKTFHDSGILPREALEQ